MNNKKLPETHPYLINEWDHIKNKDLKPKDFSHGCDEKIWWLCNKNHSWQTKINVRTRGCGCPYCCNKKVSINNSLINTNSNLINEWDFSKNENLDPTKITHGSHKKIWWKCIKNKNHPSWLSTIKNRTTRNSGCPYCSKNKCCKSESLLTIYPEIAKEWSDTKNKDKPEDVSPFSHQKRWWICSKGCPDYYSIICNRTKCKSRCPKCNMSKGELKISRHLQTKNISFKQQYRIQNCKNKIPLPFDFVIVDQQKNLLKLIEYNGIQHYICGKQFGSINPQKNFEQIQKHDKIKKDFCKNNNIPLLIINYKENIVQKLNEFLNE